MFISIEGIEGVGKSTLILKLKSYFESLGERVVLSREPGGTELSEKIRSILIDPNMGGKISLNAELFLFYASRFQNHEENLVPALESGAVLIIDRYVDSSEAYQGYGRGIDLKKFELLNSKFDLTKPDLTLWLDAPVEVGMKRALNRNKLDRFEQEKFNFFEKIRQGFSTINKAEPERFKRIDATLSEDQVFNQAVAIIEEYNKAK